MDYDKLIEQLHKEAYGSDIEDLLLDATTAIETLRADLARVTAERDAAVALVHEWEQYGRYLSPMGFTVPPNWRED